MLRHARLALAGRVLAPRAVRALTRPMPAAAPPAPSGARSSWSRASSVRGLGVRPGTLAAAAGRRAYARQYSRTRAATESLWSRLGNLFSAEEVKDTSMPAEQNKEKAAALRMSEHRFAKMRASQMKRLLNSGDVASARALMDKLKEHGKANVVHFTIMLQACKDSAGMRRIIATDMPAAGVEPDVVTFTTLVRQLIVEGDLAGAQRVVEEEMPAAGVEPDGRTLETFNKSERGFAKMRASQLRDLINSGDVASARALMDKLKEHGKANVVHFTIMLQACKDSAGMRRIIATDMPAAGVEPDVVTFTTLVRQLIVEGDLAGAQRVVEEEMPAAGVEPDGRTLETLNKS